MTLNITLLTDNSVYIGFIDKQKGKSQINKKVYNTDFGGMKPNNVKLNDILKVKENPFSFTIFDPATPDKPFYSTENKAFFMNRWLKVFSADLRINDERIFGLGEREGDFFFKNGTRVSLYNNARNLTGSRNEFFNTTYSKNGFFPAFFAQMQESTQLMAVVKMNTEPQDFAFYHDLLDNVTTATNIFSGSNLEQVVIFKLEPLEMQRALHKHV